MSNGNGYITIEQLIDIVQAELTFSGLFPKQLPDKEIKRLVKEHALEYFYKEYQFSVMKTYYFLPHECMQTEVYSRYKYFIMPEEIENIVRLFIVDDPTLFRLGIQAPHLSINLGITNQPFLTSFVTTIGDLAVYRGIISAFSDEINKMNKQTLKFEYNHLNKRFHILTHVERPLMLECFVRIEPEVLFDFQLFKDYVIGLAKIRQGELLSSTNYKLPGNMQWNAADLLSNGKEMCERVRTQIKEQTKSGWFFMSR
jgi:hypothetical protein